MKILDIPRSGSIAGTTSSHNRAGQYVRNRRAPVQPIGTGRRSFIRAAFGASSAGYAALTSAQQDAWTSYAADHPITDSLGQSITLTGQQMYVSCSVALTNVGEAPSATPPASAATINLAPVVATFGLVAGLDATWTGGDGTGWVTLAVSRPMSTGRRFNKTFWQPLGTDGYVSDDAAEISLTTAKYAAQFGTPTVGSAVFFKLTPVNAGGVTGTPVIVRVIVTA